MAEAKLSGGEYRSDHPALSFGQPRDLNMVITELKYGGLVGCSCCDVQAKYKKSEEYADIIEKLIAAQTAEIERLKKLLGDCLRNMDRWPRLHEGMNKLKGSIRHALDAGKEE